MSNFRLSHALLIVLLLAPTLHAQLPPIDYANQGSSMRLRWNNVGAFGHVACPPFNPGNPGGCAVESVGLEYPAGSLREHLYGGGIWLGGILDTATAGVSPPLRLVSLTYEGWAGPYYEFYPGAIPADTIWQADQGAPKPAGWDQYWDADLPYRPFADDNRYCRYTDTSVHIALHVPLRLKVIHCSYTWNDPYADGIQVVEYRFFNTGTKVIDSVYLGLMLEPDFGPPFPNHILTGYIATNHIAFCRNAADSSSTPLGIGFVYLPVAVDSLRWTFECFPGPNTPMDDRAKYALLSSGMVHDCEYPIVYNPRIVLAVGPFTIPPGPEPLRIATGYFCGPDLPIRLQRAKELYVQGTSISSPGEQPGSFMLMQNYPNPFNGETKIGYQLENTGSSERVTLKVYDLLGREVATLVDGIQEPGKHTVTYDGTQFPSGVYYCRLQAGAHTETKAMMLLR